MSRSLVHFRNVSRLWPFLAIGGLSLILAGLPAQGDSGSADPRLKGLRAAKGLKVRVIAAEPAILDPAAMAFDDQGNLFVAEWKPAERMIETWETLTLPEGLTTRIRRSHKITTDVVKRLKDGDGDGVYESSEVVLEGCELPTCIFPWKNSLYLACAGRLEKWSDEEGDGKFETRTVLLDGFSAVDHRTLSGITLGPDGWIYLTTADHDNRVVGNDQSRVDLIRTGGVVRSKLDGSKLSVFAMGLRNPRSGLAFDGTFHPTLIDGDLEDGSRYQGTRLIQPVEEGDYGWRTRSGEPDLSVDFDRSTAFGEKPGKLGPVANVGRGSPSGLVVYNGVAFPDSFRDLRIEADPSRRVVRGFRVENRAGTDVLAGETTLLASDDDQFRPVQVVIGADGALYVLDRRGRWSENAPSNGEARAGRLYRITWEGDASTPARALKPNHWKRIFDADVNKLVFNFMASPDLAEADRAARELVDRGSSSLPYFLGYAANTSAPLHARLLGIESARRFWSDAVENVMIGLLADPEPVIRRLAAQVLGNEPRGAVLRLIPKLLTHLDDTDPRVAREVVLAVGRHAEPRAQQYASLLLRWIDSHPQAHPIVRDGFLRAIERLGDAGVEEVALAIRTRSGPDREKAVDLFAGLRSASAAEQLDDLVKIPDLAGPERVALIRQFQEFPAGVPLPTQGLADWVARHPELEPAEKIATLDACRLAGNPASTLVLALLDDDDESVRQSATALASLSRPPKAIDRLINRLGDRPTSDAEKRAIVRALGSFGPKAFATLLEVYQDTQNPALQKAALRSMADADRARATPELEKTLAGTDTTLRSLAVRILAESPKTIEIPLRAIRDQTLGKNDLPIILGALRNQDTPESRKLLASLEAEATREGVANVADSRSLIPPNALKNGPKRFEQVLTAGPFALGPDPLRIPLDRVEPGRAFPGQDGRSIGWIPQDATSWGTLNLRGSLGSKPGRAYLAIQVRSEVAQVAMLRFGVEGASRIYLNGSKIADVAEHDSDDWNHAFDRPRDGLILPPLPDLVKLTLKPGWNLLIVGLDRTGFGDARAAFEVFAPEPIELGLPKN